MTTGDATQEPAIAEELLDRIEAGIEHPPRPDFLPADEWDQIVASRSPMIVRMAGTGHADAYKAFGGEGMDVTQGAPVLVLTMTGRKSGKEISTPLNFMEDGEDLLVVGSFAGFGGHPNWVLNLEADSNVEVQVRERSWRTTATKLTPQERAELWPRMVEHFPLWGHFQKYCRREFAVFRLRAPQSG